MGAGNKVAVVTISEQAVLGQTGGVNQLTRQLTVKMILLLLTCVNASVTPRTPALIIIARLALLDGEHMQNKSFYAGLLAIAPVLPVGLTPQTNTEPEVLIVGTFHMANRGHDVYNVQADEPFASPLPICTCIGSATLIVVASLLPSNLRDESRTPTGQ